MRPVALWGLRCGLLCALLWASASHAGSLRLDSPGACDRPVELSAEAKDTLFRFAGIVKDELDRSGARMALIARSGLDLGRFGVRYSHAGLSLKASQNTPWSVRQLYYACDEQRPRLFDQGMSGFVLGTDDPAIGHVSLVLLPPAEAAAVERVALDRGEALSLLAVTYSANAYPFSTRYQNCNQWVAELLATALGPAAAADAADDTDAADAADEANPADHTSARRARAQQWLRGHGYTPHVFQAGHRVLMWASAAIPWLHRDDHPDDDLGAMRYRVSMPASIEAFVQATMPGATRVELCHSAHRVVIHRGWDAIAEGCLPSAQDTVVVLD